MKRRSSTTLRRRDSRSACCSISATRYVWTGTVTCFEDSCSFVRFVASTMLTDPFNHDHPMILPSILSADFTRLGAEIAEVDRGGADFLHLDIMDGHFVPNISFGPAVTKAARRVTDCYLDAHLMVTHPERYAPRLVEAGA